MSSIVDEIQEIDNLVEKKAKSLLDTVDFICSVQEALKQFEPRKLTEEEKLKIKQRKILQKMANNSHFDNLQFKKEIKKNGII